MSVLHILSILLFFFFLSNPPPVYFILLLLYSSYYLALKTPNHIPRGTSRHLWSSPRDGDSTTSLGNAFQSFLGRNKSPWNTFGGAAAKCESHITQRCLLSSNIHDARGVTADICLSLGLFEDQTTAVLG